MSWDVYLEKDGEIVTVPHFEDGGTLPMGGTDKADFNITYNYGHLFRLAGLYDNQTGFAEWLTDKTGAEAAPALEKAVEKLGVARHEDYWASIPGNAGYALNRLLGWARMHPNAIFRVS